jgi:hypothetical protein
MKDNRKTVALALAQHRSAASARQSEMLGRIEALERAITRERMLLEDWANELTEVKCAVVEGAERDKALETTILTALREQGALFESVPRDDKPLPRTPGKPAAPFKRDRVLDFVLRAGATGTRWNEIATALSAEFPGEFSGGNVRSVLSQQLKQGRLVNGGGVWRSAEYGPFPPGIIADGRRGTRARRADGRPAAKWVILEEIKASAGDGCALHELAGFLNEDHPWINPNSISAQVSKLLAQGLVRREDSIYYFNDENEVKA